MSDLLDLWLQGPHKNAVVAGSLLIPVQAIQEVLSLDHQKGGVNLRHFFEIKTDHASGE